MARQNLAILLWLICGGVQAIESPLDFRNPRTRKPSPNTSPVALAVRGGDLGPIPAKTLANVFTGFASCDALGGALAPRTSMKWFGVEIDRGSLAEHYLHGIGASSATIAVSTFLAISERTSVEQAIGYGFVARLVSMTLMILFHKYHELGMNTMMFGTMWVVLAMTTYALFADMDDALALTKIVSLLLVFHGMFLYFKPEIFLKRAIGTFEKDSLTTQMASIDGGYMLLSGLVTGLLSSGVLPIKTAGYGALSYVPVLFKLLDVVEVDSLLGIDTGVWMVGLMAALAAIVAGTLN